jgi:hypothetical protein
VNNAKRSAVINFALKQNLPPLSLSDLLVDTGPKNIPAESELVT